MVTCMLFEIRLTCIAVPLMKTPPQIYFKISAELGSYGIMSIPPKAHFSANEQKLVN